MYNTCVKTVRFLLDQGLKTSVVLYTEFVRYSHEGTQTEVKASRSPITSPLIIDHFPTAIYRFFNLLNLRSPQYPQTLLILTKG
jgi:hypothetical protein